MRPADTLHPNLMLSFFASPVTQAVDAIGSMAVQLPALKKPGEEIGISLDGGVSGLLSDSPHVTPADAVPDDPAADDSAALAVRSSKSEDYKKVF